MDWIKRMLRPGGVYAGSDLPPVEVRPAPVSTPVYSRYAFSDHALRIAAVGDLHGRIDLLKEVATQLDTFALDPTKKLVEVYLGDYIDRGGNPKAVLEFLAQRSAATDRLVVCLAGNHEQMLLAGLDSDEDFLSWLSFGGQSTLLSYGVSPKDAKRHPAKTRADFRAAIPATHIDFVKGLSLFYENGGFFFVHAGIRPGKPLNEQKQKDLLWIREAFLQSSANFGAIVVHGHTPVTKPEFRSNRIGIDTGAYGSGTLTCLTITSENVTTFDTARDRLPT